jgi:PadR family transcriptional regulator PadR
LDPINAGDRKKKTYAALPSTTPLSRLASMMKQKEPRLTHASLKVLRALLDSPVVRLSGADIHKESGVFTGTLYPLLLRFEAAGWLKSEWEDVDPKEVGRPRKRFYRLTPTGRARANAALASVSSRSGEAASWT